MKTRINISRLWQQIAGITTLDNQAKVKISSAVNQLILD